jgi:cytochrome d ubiquinol oxidase subunit I
MVGLGLLMLGLGALSLLARWWGKLHKSPWLYRFALAMGPAGFVAVLAGWITTEVGRQPFTVYGLLRTSESASPLQAPVVAWSLVSFVLIYFIVFGMGVLYILRLMAHAPNQGEAGPDVTGPTRAAGVMPTPVIVLDHPLQPAE